MEGLEGEINFNILDDVIEVPPLCELSFCELLDQDTPSSITAAPGFDTEKDDTMAMYDTSSFSHETSKSNGTKAEQAEIPRERKLHRMRQRRYRQNKEKTQKTVTEKLEDARNEMRKIGKQNKKLMQENWAMSSLVDTASSMLLKMNMSISSSLSCGPHQKILLILEGLAAFRTFDHLNDEGMKIFYGTYGAQMIIRTASLYLNKRQFGKVVYIPILRTCGALMEVGDEAVLNMINKKRKLCLFVWAEEGHKHHNSVTVFAMQWCIHPARRSEVERRLIDRFDRVVAYYKAIREICPDALEAAVCPVTEYRVKLKEEYLAHLENEELVKATRLTEDQKRKLLQAWREYQRKICEINALVSSSIELLEVDSRVGGIVEDKVMMRAGPTAFAQSTNKANLSLMAFGKLRSFQKHERQAYFDLIEATFMLTPLQWFHLRLLGLLLSEDSLTGMHLAILRMS